MTQATLDEAVAARDEAIDQAEAHANAQWQQAALDCVRYCAANYHEFSTDLVWGMLDDAGYITHEPRAMGAVMRQAKRDGIVRPTGRYEQSQRVECHARPVQLWKGQP